MNRDDFHDLIKDDEEEIYRYETKPVNPIVANLMLWLGIIGGVAIGVILFLFFLALFIYIFLPLTVVFLLIYALKRWWWQRKWKKIEKSWKK